MTVDRSNKKLRNNIISSSTFQILSMIVPIITTPYVTRIFNVIQMGEYNLSLTIAILFVVGAQFGLPTYGSREIAKTKSRESRNKLFFQLELLQIVVSISLFLIYNIIFLFFVNSTNKNLFFIQSLLILVNIFDISWFFVGIEEISRIIMRNLFTKLFTTVLIFLVIKNPTHLERYAYINVMGMLVGNLSMVIQSFKYIDYKFEKVKLEKQHVIGSFTLLVPVLLNSSFSSIERSQLATLSDSKSVGIYSEAKKIIDLAFSVINSAFSALSPRMSYFVSIGEHDNVKMYFNKGLQTTYLFSAALISGMLVVSDYFVDFFYGAGYAEVSDIMMILSVSLVAVSIKALITSGLLLPNGLDREYSISIIISIISGVVLNLLLIPTFGTAGAAFAYTICQYLSLFYLVFVSRNIINAITVIFNIMLTFATITFNIWIITLISQVLLINNSIMGFLVYGILSVLINTIIFLIVKKYYSIIK